MRVTIFAHHYRMHEVCVSLLGSQSGRQMWLISLGKLYLSSYYCLQIGFAKSDTVQLFHK